MQAVLTRNTEAAEAVSSKPGLITRTRAAIASALIGLAFVVMNAVPASAVSTYTPPADPTGGQLDSIAGSVTSWVTGYGVPVLFGLTLVGIGIRLAIKYAKRAVRSV